MAYSNLARRLKFLIAGWKRHGTAHVLQVFRQERIRRRYAGNPPGLPDLPSFMNMFPWSADGQSFISGFYRSVANRLPLTRANRKDFFTNLLLSLEDYDSILTGAELISEGKFPALGICINEQGKMPDWHRDYSSGKVWDKQTPYHSVKESENDGADIKYVWELSRMYWIGWLGKAYWISNNGAWSRSFMELMDDWREQNPIHYGVNWAMPMEVAIRGFWLTMGFGMFYGAPNISDDWWLDYLRHCYAHGTYLVNNFEYFSNLTNHYISNCFGLLSLGTMFGDCDEGKRWFDEGKRRLIEELEHQVLPDGVHYERSIPYHRLVLEMYLIAISLAERYGSPFPDSAVATVTAMAEFLRDTATPNAIVPQIGDSDDGIILRLSHRTPPEDCGETLHLAAAVLGKLDLRTPDRKYSLSALFISGSASFETMMASESQSRTSHCYRDGGFAVLHNDSMHVVAKVGEIGLHGNNDVLSFTVDTPQGAFIVDPGTYCYTRDPETRNMLRSSVAHNAPVIDGAEIAEFMGLWRVQADNTRVRITTWETGSGTARCEAEHHAYDRFGITVRRGLEMNGETLAITDQVIGTGTHTVSTRFTIPDSCTVEQVSEHAFRVSRGDSVMIFESPHNLRINHGWYSPSYGVALPATFIESEDRVAAPAEMKYLCRFVKPANS